MGVKKPANGHGNGHDKPGGWFASEREPQPMPTPQAFDVTNFIRHLHGDVVAIATGQNVLFWGVTFLVFERIFYYGFIFTRWLVS
jgi:hypothetical protein